MKYHKISFTLEIIEYKNQLKPNIKPMKPIKLGNVSANIHESKKIYINENQLNLLIID